MAESKVPAKYLKKIQGKDFVLFEGLLEIAHTEGLKVVDTELVQAPSKDNGMLAIVKATVETEKGIFGALGDASPESCEKPMQPHLVRLADTRAIARAMRLAVNIGMTSSVEMGSESDGPTNNSQKPKTTAKTTKEDTKQVDDETKSAWLENPGAVLLDFGKHANKTLAEVLDEAPDYIEWLAKEAYDYVLRSAAKKLLAGQNPNGEVYNPEFDPDLEPVPNDLVF